MFGSQILSNTELDFEPSMDMQGRRKNKTTAEAWAEWAVGGGTAEVGGGGGGGP